MTQLAPKVAKRRRILRQAVIDINVLIDDLHKMPVYFDRGSLYQRLITDLDGARITARALIYNEENPDANSE